MQSNILPFVDISWNKAKHRRHRAKFRRAELKKKGGAAVERFVYEDEKIVEFWLTKAEKDDADLQQHILDESQEWKKKKYKTVVFCSGREDLLSVTKPLISYNLKLMLDKEKVVALKEGA